MFDTRLLNEEKLTTDLLKLSSTAAKEAIFKSKLDYISQLGDTIKNTVAPTGDEIALFLQEIVGLGISQKALAALFKVTTGTLSRWTTCEQPPREFVRLSLARELAEIVDYVITRMKTEMPECAGLTAVAKTKSVAKAAPKPQPKRPASARKSPAKAHAHH